MGASRWVSIGFALGGILLAIVLSKAFAGILNVARISDYGLLGSEFTVTTVLAWAVAVGATIAVYRNARYNTLAQEVAQELRKVTWPTWAETRAATVVVVVTTMIVSGILYAFDFIWSALTGKIYL